jgi:DNA primase catalytic core
MGLHKLTAGDGYTYLTRQVAAHDSTEKGHASLGEYYEQKGESPGRWLGSGLAGLDMQAGERVTAEQMKALFGHGRHPNAMAMAMQDAATRMDGTETSTITLVGLGREYPVYTGSSAFQIEVARQFTAYNIGQGTKWNTPIPAEVRAQIRTEIATRKFTEAFGRSPADARELSGFIARASRQATTAVAGYDLTFSPVKSVSALWAIAPPEVTEQIEAAHHAAVADTLNWLETEAAYTRTGRAGIRQVETNGLIAAAFTHRDARSGDPDLHTHIAISNKVQTRDGRWLALDGRVLYKAKVSASERYNTRLEGELISRLGVRFAERQAPDNGKRPVREIAGVDPDLNAFWSSRRAAIDARRAELATRFQADHGRPPTEIEAIALAQRATLETRAAKHEPRSFAEQRAAWREQAIGVLGNPRAITRMLAAVTSGHQGPASLVTDEFVVSMAGRVLGVVQSSRATWQVWHVRAEAERQARAAGIAREDMDGSVDRIVAQALAPGSSIRLGVDDPIAEPGALRRRDGSSVYLVAGSQRYTSKTIIDAEHSLLANAKRRDGRTVSDTHVGLALAESAANGMTLNPAQAQMVRELATSGSRVQVAIAPAGSGKTTAMRVLSRAWTGSDGTVIGLAPSARAAAELRREIQTAGTNHCDTLAKLTWSLTTGIIPRWVRDIGPQALVIIDEAGMAGTGELALATDYIISRGGSVRLVGDDQQLASIAAGGVLRDIAEQVGVVTLSELQRFADPAEGGATLALRLGDPAGIGFYLDNDRVHVGDETTAVEHAYRAWSADRGNGRDAVMLAPTHDLVCTLNARARTDRLAASTAKPGREALLADGNRASAGDTIMTRTNNRRLPISATDWVKNGDRWCVHMVQRSGALVVVQLGTSRKITLPASYVREHTELGYACTVHGAQGITADTCHTVASGQESRQLFYVAMSRGRKANHVYLVTASDGDAHNIIKPEALFPPTATDILIRILERDQAQQSAASIAREINDPALLLREAADRYHDALGFAAEQVVGAETLAALDLAAERIRPGLTDAPAYPTLRAHLALLAVDGSDPVTLLDRITGTRARELDSALDPAAVIDWRLDSSEEKSGGRRSGTSSPLPWLPAIPPALVANTQWGDYLMARAELVIQAATRVRTQSARWTPTTAPDRATRLLDPAHDQLRADLAVWRAAIGIPGHDRRPTGGPQLATAAIRYQNNLDARAQAVLGDPNQAAGPWAPFVSRLAERITTDSYWPELADRIAAIDRAGIDVRAVLTAVAAERPLPDEQAAAALWWRLFRHLSPAATAATAGSGAATLRPAWTPVLIDKLGQARAERVLADPAWPALVAAINGRPRVEWPPEQLLTTVIESALAVAARTGGIADGELAAALVWRIAALTDPEPPDYEVTPVDPYEAELAPPEDIHLLDISPDPNSPSTYDEEIPFDPDFDMPPLDGHQAKASLIDEDIADADIAAMQLERAIGRAQLLRGPLEPTEDELWAALDEEYHWATAEVPKARLIELNDHAADFFANNYQRSWAPAYLRSRIGTDLVGDDRFNPGYAPARWTNLTRHLQRLGATDQEILAAGLGRLASTGRVIDQFRDRLMFPIHGTDGEIHGFIGRRNPLRDADDGTAGKAGPKYLNTSRTDLFDKGAQLVGLHEGRAALAVGATPVLVEGPIDALAITLGAAGSHVGVASLGTALTDRQTNQLLLYIGADKPGVLVATDADGAGWKAAQRAYWQLTARGDNPAYVLMAEGFDPATTLERGGPDAVRQMLARSQPLARTLIDERIYSLTRRIPTAERHAAAIRAVAEVIGALPPRHWCEQIDYVTNRLDGAPCTAYFAVIDAGDRWTNDPQGLAQQHISTIGEAPPLRTPRSAAEESGRQRLQQAAKTRAGDPDTRKDPSAPARRRPEDRWRAVVASIDPRLTREDGWAALAATLDRAATEGMDIETELPRLLAEGGPLPERRAAQELQYRIIAAGDIASARNHLSLDVTAAHRTHPEPPPGAGADQGWQTSPPR